MDGDDHIEEQPIAGAGVPMAAVVDAMKDFMADVAPGQMKDVVIPVHEIVPLDAEMKGRLAQMIGGLKGEMINLADRIEPIAINPEEFMKAAGIKKVVIDYEKLEPMKELMKHMRDPDDIIESMGQLMQLLQTPGLLKFEKEDIINPDID